MDRYTVLEKLPDFKINCLEVDRHLNRFFENCSGGEKASPKKRDKRLQVEAGRSVVAFHDMTPSSLLEADIINPEINPLNLPDET